MSALSVYERWAAWDTMASQRLNEWWAMVARADPTLRQVRVTIELVFGDDQIVRAALEPMATTSSRDGRRYGYLPLLIEEPEVLESVALGEQGAAARSVDVVLAEIPIDLSALLARGRYLGGRAEISLQIDGQDHDLRWVLLRGSFSEVAFTATGRAILVSITDSRGQDAPTIPEVVIDQARFPLAQDTAIGERSPIVYNRWLGVPGKRVVDDWGSSGIQFLICEDRHGPWTVDEVYVNGEPHQTPAHSYTASIKTDAGGGRHLILDFVFSIGPWEERDVVHADISSDRLVRLSEIIRRLLIEHSALGWMRINPFRFAEADTAMPPWYPAFAVLADGRNTDTPLTVIERALLPSFPMIHLAFEGRGLGPVIYDRRRRPNEERGVLTGGQAPMIEKVGSYTERGPSQLFNHFEVRYSYSLIDKTYARVVHRDPITSPLCRLLQQEANIVRPLGVLESPYIDDDAMADYVVDWLVAHYAMPSYYVEWAVLPSVFLTHRIGQNIRYSDPEARVFTDADATIESIRYARGQVVLGIRVWHPYWTRRIYGT